MHFAFPPRKSSHPPPFAPRSSRVPSLRKIRLKGVLLGGVLLVGCIVLLLKLLVTSGTTSTGSPPVVIVTVLESSSYSKEYVDNIRENRRQYAVKHGYETLFLENADYDVGDAPRGWAKLPAMRHAMSKFPHSTYIWYLDQNTLIMNPDIAVEKHIMQAERLDELMLKNQPVVLPESLIKTFPQLRGNQIDLALAQNKDGLATTSMIVRNGQWAKFFLDTWFDPLYRSYNFQKADVHALEHIIQWHITILSRFAIIPQRIINAYDKGLGLDSQYKDGDFVIHFANCAATRTIECEKGAEPFQKRWVTIFRNMS